MAEDGSNAQDAKLYIHLYGCLYGGLGGLGLYIFVFLQQENHPYSYIRTMTSTLIHTGINTQLSNVDISE
jgi:hypothetical protein